MTPFQKWLVKLAGLNDTDIEVVESVHKAYRGAGFVIVWVEPNSVAWLREPGARWALKGYIDAKAEGRVPE